MGLSWTRAASIYDFELRFAAPEGYQPPPELVKKSGGRVTLRKSPKDAVAGAEVVVTDVWTSMGQEAELAARKAAFKGYCVDSGLMKQAKSGAIVLHCLPAHRGEEISAEVLDGPQSAAWDEAENRLHVQKALLEMLVLGHEKAVAEAEGAGGAKAS
jgi:ornithine carbamoyltransferase